ncbi:MAG: Asp-tRNA(Asn)/Glu-tRNA(Gln) amidotransferase subunit GatB [Bacteroidetes bacterium]|nr:Asp-tRNA(Asn)/Glu-tRNA(Gln) amidotransferase subunit GatB [Bacteroidota bacterium]
MNSKYEVVIGLEIHAQLLTKSKAFSGDRAEYGNHPNTNVSVVSLAHPGTLPRHNKNAVEKAIKIGLAFNCQIERYNKYSRKNYFYADLPKGYQITQFDTPICKGGFVKIKLKNGTSKKIRLTRAHMEEDTGKSIHDIEPQNSLIDYNRAGTPLIEIVTEPDIRTGEEAFQFLTEVRKILRYLDVCDGNMEEGSLRCDCNISVRPIGSSEFGTKVEVKNMNSMSNVKRAIEFETERQITAIEKGEKIAAETRSFDALKNLTFSLRSKEMVNDYRYFPEPDLPPLIVSDEMIKQIAKQMPQLPEQLYEKFLNNYNLGSYDASVLTETKEIAAFFESICKTCSNYKAAANWTMVHIKGYLNENALEFDDFKLSPEKISNLINLIDEGKISNSAAQKVFAELINHPNDTSEIIAQRLNLIQTSDTTELEKLIETALNKYPQKINEYKSGKTGLLGLFMGEVMKLSGGKADPKIASKLIKDKLEK